MLHLEPLIVQSLAALPALAAWQARSGTTLTNRARHPAFDVRLAGAAVQDANLARCTLRPDWAITLVIARAADAAEQLDGALAAVIEALHGWRPQAAHAWGELQLARVLPVDFADVQLAGYELMFSTSSVYTGHGQ